MKNCRMCGAASDEAAQVCSTCDTRFPRSETSASVRSSLQIRSVSEIKAWLTAEKSHIVDGSVSALGVINAFVQGGSISAAQLRDTLKTGARVADVGLASKAALDVAEAIYEWFEQGEAAAARVVFVALNALAPSAYFENLIGACSHQLDEHEDALLHYERALKLEPDHSDARWNHATELICVYQTVEGLVELVQLSLLDADEKERKLASKARGSLEEFWKELLAKMRDTDDPQSADCGRIYNEVRTKAKESGVWLPLVYPTSAERLEAARRFIQSMNKIGMPFTEEQSKTMEAEFLKCPDCHRQLAEGEDCTECAKHYTAKASITLENELLKQRVFVSYRRQDTGECVQNIVEALRLKLNCVYFVDKGGIDMGEDYVRTLRDKIDSSPVFLEIVGSHWMSPRLQDNNDVLRREIAWALSKKKRIFPVLIDGARMPEERELAEEIRPFARIQAHLVRLNNLDCDALPLAAKIRQELVEPAQLMVDFQTWANEGRLGEIKVYNEPFFESFPLSGDWELTISHDQFGNPNPINVAFTISEHTFRGTWSQPQVSTSYGMVAPKTVEIEGSVGLNLVNGPTGSDIVTGLLLEGVSAGQRFDLPIPIAQTLGEGYQGEDDSGRSYFLKPVNRSRPKKVF